MYKFLIILSMITIMGCATQNPYEGNWHGKFQGHQVGIKIFNTGKFVTTKISPLNNEPQITMGYWAINNIGELVIFETSKRENQKAMGFVAGNELYIKEESHTIKLSKK